MILDCVVSQGLSALKCLYGLRRTHGWPGPLLSFPTDPTFSGLDTSGLCEILPILLCLPLSLFNFRA